MKGKANSNRLFMGILILSLGIHAAVFLHIAGVYRSHALTFIELTLQDISQPERRNIPRPRPRLKHQPELLNPSARVLETSPLPSAKPVKIDPLESVLPDGLMERIETASVPQISGVALSGTDLRRADGSALEHYDTSNDYFQMVRLRIEGHKHYPQQARAGFREGRVVLSFTITTDGGIRSLEVRKSSNTKVLDEAALQAVRSAAPFPAPPRHLFKGDIPLQLTIAFELT
jgi:protein TonB